MWGVGLSYGLYQTVKVGDSEEILLGYGPVGNTNPVFTSYQQGVMSAGAVFELYAKKDGWMTVFTRMNPGKQYVVFEGKDNGIPYTLGVAGDGYMINYSLPGKTMTYETGEETYTIDFDVDGADRYFREATVQQTDASGIEMWMNDVGEIIASETRPDGCSPVMEVVHGEYAPEYPYIAAGLSEAPATSTGYLTFKVRAGRTYYVSALGSKMICPGFVFSSGEKEPAVTFVANEYLPEVRFKTDVYVPDVSEPDDPYVGNPEKSGSSTIMLATDDDLMSAGLETTKQDIPGGTLILNGETGKFSLAYDDEWGTAASYGKYRTVRIHDSEEITLGQGAVGNPNLLLYVVSKEYAPVGFEGNVVEAGVCDLLTLTPGYPFTPVREFRALQSRMVKKFNQKTYIGLCSGWESIVLPFDVKNVYAENIGSNLTPYGIMTDRHKQRPYWLYEADADGDWKEAYSINAGVPYILSVPNNSAYPDGFNVMGDVVFSSDIAQQISPDICSPATITWNSGQEFRALWLPLGEDEKADAMAINVGRSDITDDNGQPLVPGSAFCAGLEPKPLEAYVAAAGAERMMRIFGDASGVESALGGNGVDVSAAGGEIRVSSDVDRTLDIVTPDGKVARKLQLKAGEIICVTDLHGGIYLVAGRKIIVK